MDSFITWEALITFGGLTSATYMVVEFTKEIKWIKKIPTRYWCFVIAFLIMILTNVVLETFDIKNLLLYVLNSILITFSSNGLSDFNKDRKKSEEKED